MTGMGETMRVKLVDVGKNPSKHMGKLISGSSLMGTIAVLAWLGINPLNFIVGNASVFTDHKKRHWELYTKVGELQVENQKLHREIKHFDHLVESQNFVLLTMFRNELITIGEYTSMIHAVDHRRDSL